MTEPDIGQQILHYQVLAKLGQGGMGAVYLAEDTKLNRRVALKFLPAEMAADTERLRRFEREAQTVAALNHPNIVTIYSVEEHEGIPFIAMELVEGKALSELIPDDGLKLEAIFDIAIPMADAVSAAHERGISHRDLKPGNIMIGADDRVKVLDFGLAKLMQDTDKPDATALSTQTLTKTGHTLGTVTYMAPEQLKGKSPDQRADIFSLGIVLYQMASGQRPFQGETSAEVISSILRDAPPPVTDLKIELPSHLARIVKRCLEKNPNHRYQTAAELRNELEELRREVESGTVFEDDAKTRAIKIQRSSRRTFGAAAVIGGIAFVAALGVLLITLFGRGSPDDAVAGGDPALNTIAVLPFTNVGESGDQVFSDGLNEELGSLLTSLPDLQVVSRATARQQFQPQATTREIGETLGADYLILGSVRWSDPGDDAIATTRTHLQVIRVVDDIQVWSDSYDRQLTDELRAQSEIATLAVRSIGSTVLNLSAEQLPEEPEAVEPPVSVAETRQPDPPRPRPARQPTAPPPAQPTESRVTKIEETPVAAESQVEVPKVTLDIEMTTFESEGVLTLYADDKQVLSEDFRFEGRRRGLLGRRKAAGELSARQSVPLATRSLRVYMLVGNETRLVTLEPDFGGANSYRLLITLTRKGELEAALEPN